MNEPRTRRFSNRRLSLEVADLQVRLTEANDALRAIRRGEVDAVVVTGKKGPQVFTLTGAEHVYRVLIESMNEGALTLTPGEMIFYSNRCFAKMVGSRLEKVIGGSLGRFLSDEDRARLSPLLKRTSKSGSKIQVLLIAANGLKTPVQVSIRPLAGTGSGGATIGMVVTDLTEARRAEEMLRALTQRVVQVQEDERGRVAFELHDNITQLICAALFRSQALAKSISPGDGTSKKDAIRLLEMLGETAQEVERITHNLGPNVLEHLGLVAALGDTGTEFKARTGIPVKLVCTLVTARLPADVELAFLRILQEALRNIEKHASARHIVVRLSKKGEFIRLAIKDDGAGFSPSQSPGNPESKGRLGLISMRERAASVGGTLRVKSVFGAGTEIEAVVPIASKP